MASGGPTGGPSGMRVVLDGTMDVADGETGTIGFSTNSHIEGAAPNSWVMQEVRWWEYGLDPTCGKLTWETASVSDA